MTSVFIHLTTRRRSVTILLLVIAIALMAGVCGSAVVPIAAKKQNTHEGQ
jgi:hypothetical protein